MSGFYPFNPGLGQKMQGSAVGAREIDRAFIAHLALTAAEAATASTTGVLPAQTANTAFDVTTGITSPPAPRNITATTTGTGANVTAQVVTVTGTDESGAVITESLPAFTAGSLGSVVGNKAFKTVTRLQCAAAGAAVQVSVGFGDKLGIPHKLTHNTVQDAYLNNVKEGTAPTVAVDSVNLSGNTVDLSSALNGTPVDVYYLV